VDELDLQQMKSMLYRLFALAYFFCLVNCSCEMNFEVYQAQSGTNISKASFRSAAESAGLKAIGSDGEIYEKHGMTLCYRPQERIELHSIFCPTPLTLLTWGADARACEERRKKIGTEFFSWYAKRGITLKRVELSTLTKEARKDGSSSAQIMNQPQ